MRNIPNYYRKRIFGCNYNSKTSYKIHAFLHIIFNFVHTLCKIVLFAFNCFSSHFFTLFATCADSANLLPVFALCLQILALRISSGCFYLPLSTDILLFDNCLTTQASRDVIFLQCPLLLSISISICRSLLGHFTFALSVYSSILMWKMNAPYSVCVCVERAAVCHLIFLLPSSFLCRFSTHYNFLSLVEIKIFLLPFPLPPQKSFPVIIPSLL